MYSLLNASYFASIKNKELLLVVFILYYGIHYTRIHITSVYVNVPTTDSNGR